MKKNRKGFTLVELLAVIVILALLIVITANTILPMLGRTKQTGMITYAKRVLNNAQTNLAADEIVYGELENAIVSGINVEATVAIYDNSSFVTNGPSMIANTDKSIKYYAIEKDLTNNHSYFGCVQIVKIQGTYFYELKLFTTKDWLYMNVRGITDVSDLGEVTFKNLSKSAYDRDVYSSSSIESSCNGSGFYNIPATGIVY